MAGAKDRATNKISAEVVPAVTRPVLHGFAYDRIAQGTEVFTDDLKSYEGLHNHRSVRHSVGEYVDGKVHINGMESFWSMLKRGYYGTYHRLSPLHLQQYINEFAGRHNQRPLDTIEQMRLMAAGLASRQDPDLQGPHREEGGVNMATTSQSDPRSVRPPLDENQKRLLEALKLAVERAARSARAVPTPVKALSNG